MMKRFCGFMTVLLIFAFLTLGTPRFTYAVCEIPNSTDIGLLRLAQDECQKEIDARMSAHIKNKEELAKLEKDLETTKKLIQNVETQINGLEKKIFGQEVEMEYQKEILAARVRSYYKKSQRYSLFLFLMFSPSANDLFRELSYWQTAADQDKNTIIKISQDLTKLNDDKIKLEVNRAWLIKAKDRLDQNTSALKNEVDKVETYFRQVSSKIAELTARQQEILGQKLAGLNIPRSALSLRVCIDDRPIDPGFSPRFAFFTFGVPNRIGLNQYGAKGRAEAGQDARTILSAYYNADYTTGYNQSINIHVVGTNEYEQSFDNNWNIEEYLKHLYEIPTDWPTEALRSQAIAARSYALAYTNNGSTSICPSQKCQVVKQELNNDVWQQAVRDTAGIVLTNGGQPIKAWFSSTHGGYVFASGDLQGWSSTAWTKRVVDTASSINSFSDLFSLAYDHGSPWFYCDWGGRAQYNKTAWLKPEEIADIVNVILLARKDSSIRPHLYQTDKPNPEGVDTWDAARVRSELGSSAFNTISDIGVDWDRSSGITTQVRVSGDPGSQSFDGGEFKNFFNLRAPTNIQIVGPLFNIEKK